MRPNCNSSNFQGWLGRRNFHSLELCIPNNHPQPPGMPDILAISSLQIKAAVPPTSCSQRRRQPSAPWFGLGSCTSTAQFTPTQRVLGPRLSLANAGKSGLGSILVAPKLGPAHGDHPSPKIPHSRRPAQLGGAWFSWPGCAVPLERWFLWDHGASPELTGLPAEPGWALDSRQGALSELTCPWHRQSRPGFAPSAPVQPRDTNRGRSPALGEGLRSLSPFPHLPEPPSPGMPGCERPRWDTAGARARRCPSPVPRGCVSETAASPAPDSRQSPGAPKLRPLGAALPAPAAPPRGSLLAPSPLPTAPAAAPGARPPVPASTGRRPA